MEKKISRTFKFYKVMVKDAVSGEILREETTTQKPSNDKVAIKFIKETGKTGFIIEVEESEVQREMSLETFIANSVIVEPKQENTEIEGGQQ